MNKKILFIVNTPVNEQMINYYRINMLINSGFSVSFLDVTYLINSAHLKKNDELKNMSFKVYSVNKLKQAVDLIRSMSKDTVILISFGNEIKTWKILREISKSGLKYGSMALNSIYEGKMFRKKVIKVKEITPSRVLGYIYRQIPVRYLGVRNRDFFITNSKMEIKNHKLNLCDDKTDFLVTHSNAYDDAIRQKTEKRIIENPYCIWLDIYFPYHPDLIQYGVNFDDKIYFSLLKDFFSWIEESYGIEVIIAAHPKSDYDIHHNAFSGYQIIKGHTNLLVRDCEFVLTSFSSSFMYAITYMKPIIIVNHKMILEKLQLQTEIMSRLADRIDQNIIVLDEFMKKKDKKKEFDLCLFLNKEKYISLGREYIYEDFDGLIEEETSDKVICNFLFNV